MPETFQIVLLPDAHFSLHALDAFERTQCIREVYVPNGDSLQLLLRPGCEDCRLRASGKRQRPSSAAVTSPTGHCVQGRWSGFSCSIPGCKVGRWW